MLYDIRSLNTHVLFEVLIKLDLSFDDFFIFKLYKTW